MQIMSIPMFWAILGLVMVVAEVFLPGLVIVFFGGGALLTALCTWIFKGMPTWCQLMVFAISSTAFLLFVRRWFLGKEDSHGTVEGVEDACIGARAVVVEAIDPKLGGKVELNGVNWNAVSETPIEKNAPVEVISRKGLTLAVKSL